jgi:flagellar hook-length control protein FliK
LDAQAEAVKSKASSVNSLQSRNDSTAGSDAVTGKDGGVEALNPGANGGLNGGNPAVTPSSTNKESEVSASARSTSSKKGGVTMAPDSSNQGSPITSTVDAPGGKPVLSAMSQGTLDSTTRLNAVKQVADRLQVMAATRPQNAVTIELTPAGLGTVSVTVKGIGKTIIADLAASNDAVRAALSEGRNTLTQAMEQKGFTVSELNVRTHVAASQAGAGMSNANQGRQDQPSSQNQQWTGQASSQTPGFNAQGQAFAHSQNSRQGGSGSRFQAGQDQDLTPQASKASASASLDLSI